jgi:hypothetical protein
MRILAPRAVLPFGLLLLMLAACAATWSSPTPLLAAASTTDFYVDLKKGSDANPGSADLPWRTIQKAAGTLAPGDTVHVRPGDYGERVQVSRSGAKGAPITYRAEGVVKMKGFTVRADHIAIQGFEIRNTDNEWDNGVGIFVEGSYCALDNNYIHDATRGGIVLFARAGEESGPTGCRVTNNRLYHNALSGIEIHGSKHVVEGNEIWATIQHHPKWTNPPDWIDADGIRFFGSGHRISRNYIHDISFDQPENVNPHIDCFQTWGPASDTVLEYNACDELQYQAPHERGQGFMIEEKDGPVRDITIRHNTVRAYTQVVVLRGEALSITDNQFSGDLSLPQAAQGAIELFGTRSAVVKNNRFCGARTLIHTEQMSDEALTEGNNVVQKGKCPPVSGPPAGPRPTPTPKATAAPRRPAGNAAPPVARTKPVQTPPPPKRGILAVQVEARPRLLPR